MIGLIPSIMNLISLFVTNEGFFDPVAHNSTLGLPANATFAPGHPSLELTDHPNIHGGDGWVNFGVVTGVSMLAMLAVGGRLGDDISNRIIAALGSATSSDDDDSSRQDDGDDRDNDDPGMNGTMARRIVPGTRKSAVRMRVAGGRTRSVRRAEVGRAAAARRKRRWPDSRRSEHLSPAKTSTRSPRPPARSRRPRIWH